MFTKGCKIYKVQNINKYKRIYKTNIIIIKIYTGYLLFFQHNGFNVKCTIDMFGSVLFRLHSKIVSSIDKL